MNDETINEFKELRQKAQTDRARLPWWALYRKIWYMGYCVGIELAFWTAVKGDPDE